MRKIIDCDRIQMSVSDEITLTPEIEKKMMELAVDMIITIPGAFPDAPEGIVDDSRRLLCYDNCINSVSLWHLPNGSFDVNWNIEGKSKRTNFVLRALANLAYNENKKAIQELEGSMKLKAKDVERIYKREKDAMVYWLVDKVPYGAKMGIGGVFKISEGKLVMEMDLTDDELQDLIVELSGYFNDIKI